MEERKTGEFLENEKTLEELQEENRRLQEENERLNRSIKERLYDKIHVSVHTLDLFITAMCVLFVVVVIMGMLK